jgi:MFS family permease
MTRMPRPVAFLFLVLPFGASFGYVSVALPYLATQRGIRVEHIGAVIALAYTPHTWKFFWAPVVDSTLTLKRWYLLALGLVGLGTFASAAMPLDPGALPLITGVVVASQVGLTLLAMACEAMMGLGVPEAQQGRASGFFNAGILLGSGLGGGAALWLSEQLPKPWMVGAALAAVMMLSAIPLLTFDEPVRARHEGGLRASMRALFVDLKALLGSRFGLIGLFICMTPVGTGALTNLFSAIGTEWGASAKLIALTTGVLGGVIAAGGGLAGGWLADRVPRRLAYAIAGALTALVSAALALAPMTPTVFGVLGLAYYFFYGVATASMTAFVLETIGRGAVATKYNVFVSLANLAIGYSTAIDSYTHGRYGVRGMLWVDAAQTAVGLALIGTFVWLMRSRPAAATAHPANS